MKRFLKRFTTLLLIFVMLLEIAPLSVFASGGGSSSPATPSVNHNAVNTTTTKDTLPGTPGYFTSGHVGRSEDTANMQSYILAVSLGLKQDVEIDSVIISYYTDADNEKNGTPFHQVLEVNRVEGDAGINAAILEGVNAIYDTSQNWPFYGSKYATFRSLVGDGTSASSSYYTFNNTRYRKNFSNYAAWAKSLVPDVDTSKFPSAAEKYGVSFPAFSTEYIRFRLEYNLYTLVSVEFIVSKTEGPGLSGEFAINGWSLFKEATSKSNGKTVSAGLSATNYAFISDRLGLTFSGTPLGKSTDIANTKTNTGVVVTKNSSIKYFNKYAKVMPVDKLDSKEEFPNSKDYDIYRTDTLDGNLITLCCTCTPELLTDVSAPVLEIYNFEIALADVYEGGIEGFNVVKGLGEAGNPLNLHDMLTANIEYVDSYGILQTVSVPVISNALLEYGIPVDANLSQAFVDAVKNGQYVSFAQQGDKLYFSVEFPGIQKINAVNLSYFNPVSLNDQVAISSIAIYSNGEMPNVIKQKLHELESAWANSVNERNEAEDRAERYYMSHYRIGRQTYSREQLAERDFGYRSWLEDVERLRAEVESKKLAMETFERAVGGMAKKEDSHNQVARRDLYVKEPGEIISMDIGKNFMLYLSTNPENIWLDNGTLEYRFEMKDVSDIPSENQAIPNRIDVNDMYLVSLTASNIGVASTVDDLYFSLEYIDNQDNKQETSEILVQEAAQEFAGYVAGVVTKDTKGVTGVKVNTAVDVAYYYGMNHGNTMQFLVRAKNAKQFTAANFRMGDGEDEWQMNHMTITRLESYGKRQFIKLNATDYTSVTDTGEVDFSLNHTYKRDVKGQLLNDVDIVMLLQRKGEGRIDLIKGSTETKEEKRENYEEYEYSMTYEMATSDLKFDTAVQQYEVRVKVAPNSSNSVVSDNSGSNNMFYFQLVFKNGKKSGYVLANKQLSSDGFRSGVTESFIISTNTDCGDVSAVYVIADDISSNSAPLDKLNVQSIEVIKKNTNTPDKRFVAENIGWISTGYIDTSEATERQPRTESELANSFAIQYSAYMIGLEVAMAYGPYDPGIPQFEGNMTVDLYYENSAGEAKDIRGIDVVQAMYDYMNKTALISTDNKKAMSDSNYMFRAEHIDRFIIDVEDCVKIKRLVFHGDPLDNTALAFKDIKISALRSKGSLAINDEGEFYRVYSNDLSPILVAELATTPKSSYQFSYGQNNLASFYLSSEEFPEFGESTNMSAMISRVPDSADDVMNLYIFLSEGTDFPEPAGNAKNRYDILATVRYKSTVDSRLYTSQVENRKDTNRYEFQQTTIDGQKVIYKTGISAPNFSAISSINLYSNDWTKTLSADRAMVQQVRRGVVINTFDIPLPGHTFSVQNGASASFAYSATDAYNTQQIKLILSENTPSLVLTPEEEDIAVRFHYTSKALGGGEYTSKWVFATDSGTTAIHAGSQLTFDYNEYGVGEISMIEIQCSGGVIAYIDTTDGVTGITAVCREGSKAVTPVEVARYSFYTTGEVKLSAVIQRFNAEKPLPSGNNILKNVEFAFKTMSTSSVIDSAGTAPIKATITYITSNDSKTIIIDDIREYVSTSNASGVFAEGQTANVSLMLPGFESIYSVKLEPKDNNPSTTARWNLESVSYRAEGIADESTHTISVNQSIAEGSPYTIDFVEKQAVITDSAIE